MSHLKLLPYLFLLALSPLVLAAVPDDITVECTSTPGTVADTFRYSCRICNNAVDLSTNKIQFDIPGTISGPFVNIDEFERITVYIPTTTCITVEFTNDQMTTFEGFLPQAGQILFLLADITVDSALNVANATLTACNSTGSDSSVTPVGIFSCIITSQQKLKAVLLKATKYNDPNSATFKPFASERLIGAKAVTVNCDGFLPGICDFTFKQALPASFKLATAGVRK